MHFSMRLMFAVAVGCLGFNNIACAQDIQAQPIAAPITPRTLPPVLAAAAMPTNPTFLVNRRQADLRDHHFVRAPVATVPTAPFAVLPAIPTGTPTTVAPVDAGTGSPVLITYNAALEDVATGGVTSTVGEPSVADSEDGVVLVAGNWFASISKDNGLNYSFRDPSTAFPSDAFEWCCDQVVIYDPTRDMMIWYLQYVQDGHQNIGRLAVATGGDISGEKWTFYDLSPLNVGGWNDEWFDYADLAIAGDHLYLSTNSFATNGTAFSEDDSFARALVVRVELSDLAAAQPITPMFFDAEDAFSLKPTHGATSTMFFGSHDFATLGTGIMVFEWPQASDTVQRHNFTVQEWSNAGRQSEAPDGTEWLRRTDFRMTAGWATGRKVGFGWSGAQDSNFRHPHIRIALIDLDAADDQQLAEPHIWSDDFAFAYPSTAVNSNGRVGISLEYGGGGIDGINPSHAVGVLHEGDDGAYTWLLQQTKTGTNGPIDARWGDYLTIRPAAGNSLGWIATGYTLEGGGRPQDVVPRVVRFEQLSPAAAVAAAVPAGAAEQLRQQIRKLQADVEALAATIEGE